MPVVEWADVWYFTVTEYLVATSDTVLQAGHLAAAISFGSSKHLQLQACKTRFHVQRM